MSTSLPVTGSSDFAVQIRDAAVTSLLGYNTLAGLYVEAMRLDPIGRGDMPRIVVRMEEDGRGTSEAGTEPKFDITASLVVECYAERARTDDAVDDIDTMIAQVKDCLLGDPTWVARVSQISDLAVRRMFRQEAERVIGEGHVLLKLRWRENYPPRVTQDLQIITTTINARVTPVPPQIGAIRFDGWWGDPTVAGSVAAQLAQVLSPAQFQSRLPWFASVTAGVATWSVPTQVTMDHEIAAAVAADLAFWAFDSFQPTDPETLALTLYLSSALRGQLQFAMLGQMDNWVAENGSYNPSLSRDIAMFAQPGYLKTPSGQPVYFVLGGGSLTLEQQQAAIATIRSQSQAQGTGTPYIVALSSAPLEQDDNVTNFAIPIGADAAATATEGILRGVPQPYSQLVADGENDWVFRAAAGFPMVPTACAGNDITPFVVTTEPFYAAELGSDATLQNYFQQGTAIQIADHISDLAGFIANNATACVANIGLIDAWNDYAAGGWIAPSYLAGVALGDLTRCQAIGAALPAPSNGQIMLATSTITLPLA